MTITTDLCSSRALRSVRLGSTSRRAGFYLFELLVATGVVSIVMAIIAATVIFLGQWFVSLGNYLEMNQQSRFALEIVGRDLRMASSVTTLDQEQLTVMVPLAGGGSVAVEYQLQNGNLIRREGADVRQLLSNIDNLEFTYFDALGQSTDRRVDVKMIQVNATMRRLVRRATNTNYLISARFTMRNKIVGN